MPASAPARELAHPDITPENPPERAAHYVDAPNLPWEATKFPGIQIKVLYTDASGITTALFKLAPGAVVPLHEHTALEQTYVIEGSLEDHEGTCGPGQFVWRPAGNRHEAVAPRGAVLLGFFLTASPMARNSSPPPGSGSPASHRDGAVDSDQCSPVQNVAFFTLCHAVALFRAAHVPAAAIATSGLSRGRSTAAAG